MRNLLTFLLFLPALSEAQTRFNVYFDTDAYRLEAAQRHQLDSLLDAQANRLSTLHVTITGHCDARASTTYNDSLSARRVQSVRTYLVESGRIPSKHIHASARGERQPLNKNRTEDEWKLNRRVEIVFNDSTVATSLEEQLKDPTLTVGTNIVLKNINFYGGRRQWLPASQPVLDELLRIMKSMPSLVIEIQGHICCEPGDTDGLDIETGISNLSMVRAETIHNFLLANGIEANRVSWRGFGHSQPIYPYPENSEEERIANRRVEIKILRK